MAKKQIDKAAAHANQPGEGDDTLDVTLDDGTVVTDTPMRIIERVQAGEFTLKPDEAEVVADLHNGAVLDPAKDTGSAELVEPETLTKAPEGNGEAPSNASGSSMTASSTSASTLTNDAPAVPPAETTTGSSAEGNGASTAPAENGTVPSAGSADAGAPTTGSSTDSPATPEPAAGTPAITNTDTGLAAAAPQITEAPGPSTQADSSTTVSGQPVITEDNPVVGLERTESVKTAATPADVTAIAPAPDGNSSTMAANTTQNATAAEFAASPTPPQNQINPRAQDGSDVELTGEKAAAQIAPTEPSTWTPSAALAPQEPTTLAEHAQAEALKAAANEPGAGSIEDRLAALEKRIAELEERYEGVDVDLDHLEDRVTALEPGVS